jgi:outer membrane lipoprotein carrier protein
VNRFLIHRSRRLYVKVILLSFYLAYCPYLSAEQNSSHLDKFLFGLETFQASFEQTLLNQYEEEIEKSRGIVQLRRPGMFHWTYTEPYEQNLISDGVNLWVYDKDLEQVSIRDISNILEDSPAAILGGEIVIDAHYVVIEYPGTDDSNWLELTPRDIESQYSAIRLQFLSGELVKMILFDALGQITQIELRELQRNIDIGINVFQFTPPESVDVIDSRE